MEPTMRNLEDVIRRAARTNGPRTRALVRHEFDVDGNSTSVYEFATEPFIKNMLDWVTFTLIFNTDSNGMDTGKESFECVPIANRFPIRKLTPRSSGDCGKGA